LLEFCQGSKNNNNKATLDKLNKKYLFLLLFLVSPLYVQAIDDENYIDERPVFLDEYNSSPPLIFYHEFLECLRTGDFSPDHGPRKLNTQIQRFILTEVNNDKWAFEVKEHPERVIIKYIVINTRNIHTIEDKLSHMLYIISRCKLSEDRY